MSTFKRDKFRKKLAKLLARSPDSDFIQLAWAVDALQSDNEEAASHFITYPKDAAASEIGAKLAIHPWEIETLIGQLFLTPKIPLHAGLNKITNCGQFHTLFHATQLLRALENEEYGILGKNKDVLDELPRIAHREFGWQRGYSTVPQLYRYAFMYGQGECGEFFKTTYGLTYNDFSLVGFALFASFLERPFRQNFSLREIGVSESIQMSAMKLLSAPIHQARSTAVEQVHATNRKYGTPQPIAYQPSILRTNPIITFGSSNEKMYSPLPVLINVRTTSGVFYDLIKGGTHLRNEASDRFEKYCAELIASTMPRFKVLRSEKYKAGNNKIDSSDIRLKENGKILTAIECKATRLNFHAQFADDPIAEAKNGYDELSKGVFQLWRYFSHARRGLVDVGMVDTNTTGLVLTLDPWLSLSTNPLKKVLANAEELARKDAEILPQDRRKICFCNIQDFESVVLRTDEDALLQVFAAGNEDRFFGWDLSGVCRELDVKVSVSKDYPFELKNVLPWQEALEKLKDQQGSKNS